MLSTAKLLKHRILIGLIYGCGLRCLEVRNIRLVDLQFERMQLHIVQSKGNKDRYVPLSHHLIRGIQKYIASEHPQEYLFNGKPNERAGGDFDFRYSQRGVQWVIQSIAKQAGLTKRCIPIPCVIAMLRICLKMVSTSLHSKIYWDINP